MDKLTTGYGLIEGPVWHPQRGLIFSDVLFGGVFALAADGAVQTLFEHRRGIGGIALHEQDGLIVSGRNLSFKPFDGGPTRTVCEQNEAAGIVGFNDLTTDSSGRIYAGSLGASPVFDDGRAPRAGDLYRIELDGSSSVVGRDVQLTNGLGWSPDGRILYHSDSRRQTVFCYELQDDDRLGEKQLFTRLDSGVPDGLVVSEDGAVWVALAGGGQGVAVFDTQGRQRDYIEIPEPMCTSLCFGGNDLRELYIVSGSDGTDSDRAGSVYRLATDVRGIEVAVARVALH